MKRIVLLAIILSGCANNNSGVIADGKESYRIIISGGHGLVSSATVDLKITAHKQANEFCSGLNKRHETVYEKATQPWMQSDNTEYDLKFKCVTGADGSATPEPH